MPSMENTCPLCRKEVIGKFGCYECMDCDQKFHGKCATKKSYAEKPTDRYLIDDLVICPQCGSNEVESCADPGRNANQAILNSIELNGPNKRGGRKRKSRKARKSRKSRKSRKYKRH